MDKEVLPAYLFGSNWIYDAEASGGICQGGLDPRGRGQDPSRPVQK